MSNESRPVRTIERRAMKRSILIALSVMTVIAAATAVQAQERYAVLVGVGEYPNLREKLQLKGPPNDVRLMRKYLTDVEGFAEEKIFQLTDGGPHLPRRANIIDTLENLIERVNADDFVLFYFAGHGSQQPDGPASNEEFDGYDEIFLPADVKDWNKGRRTVDNAIVDDEIGEFIKAYRHKGVDVWVIFDSCSSGTMTRGVGDELTRTRRVLPKDLGIPDNFDDKRALRSGGQLRGDSDAPAFTDILAESSESALGALFQFFASHAAEETPERLLPRGVKKSEQEIRGLFTDSLVGVLSLYPNVSYDELAQMIIAKYSSISHNSSTPQFYGTDMNRRVFGRDSKHSLVFRATLDAELMQLTVGRAGKLRGFDVGARVSVHPHAADTSILGTGVVNKATLTESTIVPDWKEDATKLRKHWKPVHVRLVQPAYKPTVWISPVETARDADNHRLREIIGTLKKDAIPLVEFSGTYDSDADYFAAFFDDMFWLLRPGQTLPCEVQRISEEKRNDCKGERVPEQLFRSEPNKVAGLVWKAAKVRNLVKLQAFAGIPDSLKLKVEIGRRKNIGPSGERPIEYLSLADIDGVLQGGDTVFISTSEKVREARDVSFFWIDSSLGIAALQEFGRSVRVQRGDSINRKPVVLIGTRTVGTESLVIIADPARDGDGREANYRFLAEEGYDEIATRGTAVRTARSPLQAILEGVWAGHESVSSRSARTRSTHGSQAHVKVFTFRVEK